MRVKGTLTIEGVNLHLNVSAPDDQQEIYLANVHPSCMVIPKDRWKIEYLGLPPEAVQELRSRNISVLGQLVNETWTLGVDGLNDEMRVAINEALDRFLDIALRFELPPEKKTVQVPARPQAEVAASPNGTTNGAAPLDLELSVIGLLKGQETAVKKKGAATLGDLLKLGRNRILMIDKMDVRGMEKIEAALRSHGLKLSDDPQTPS